MEPQIRYARTPDGLSLAWYSVGTGTPLLWMSSGPYTHTQFEWQIPETREILERIAAAATLVRYDVRGFSMSDREVEGFPLEAMVTDLETIVRAAGFTRFVLLVPGLMSVPALVYAARHPETLTALLLTGGVARGVDASGPEFDRTLKVARDDWEVAKRLLGGTSDLWTMQATVSRLQEMLDRSATQATYIRWHEDLLEWDASEFLADMTTPTLVTLDGAVLGRSAEASRRLAAALPNATLALVRPGTDDLFQVTAEFLARVAPPAPADATIISAPAPAMSFAGGRYDVVRVLGEGGQKVVYLVHDNVLDRDCALSMIRSELLEADDLERLRREAQAMARLGAHSNVVSVFDFGDQDGKPYLVCEYVPAGELRRHIRDAAAPLALERAVAIAADIARALSVAHARGVVHRDVKPANIWLTEDGAAKLGDFGLAFSLDRSRMTMPGTVMGTAAYLAPEQALGQPVTERSDLYALGCVLYEMVCGAPPFSDANVTLVIAQHMNATPVAPSSRGQALPPELEALIMRLLAKSPDARPQSAAAVLEELRAISEGLRTPQPARGERTGTGAQIRSLKAPEVRYCTTADGIRIAYCVEGEGPPLLMCTNFIESFSVGHYFPQYEGFWRKIAEHHQLIRFDIRGTGLSQRNIEQFSLAGICMDMEAVVEAVGLKKFAVWAAGSGGVNAIRYAATHSRNVDSLIIYGSYLRVTDSLSADAARAAAALWRTNPEMAAQAFADRGNRHRHPEVFAQVTRTFRESVHGEDAARLFEAALDPTWNAEDSLSLVSARTLVMHRRDDAVFPFAAGQAIAAGIKNARFLPLQGDVHDYAIEDSTAVLDATLAFLAEDVGAPQAVQTEPPPAEAGFVGRTPELEQLTAALERTSGGAGALVMVVGEPGIGKTRLLEQFAARAHAEGARVLTGRCYDGDWAPPFSPFAEAIKQHAAATSPQALRSQLAADAGVLARIVPALHERLPNIAEPPAIPAEGERYRLLEAVSDTLGRLAAERPLVLVLDDLHWADKGTIAMLQQVARTCAGQRVLVLGAYRDVELDRAHPLAEALTALRREKHFERIALRGLDGAEVAELIEVIAEQDVPATLSEAIARETEGNPFFIKEVLLHLVEEKKIVQQDGTWTSKLSIAEMGIPEGVREVIGRRLSRVGETCGRMLTVASALTAGFSWEVIAAVAGEPEAALLDAVDEALTAQLFVERERGRYEFTHALIRHTLYEGLSTPRRVLLHRQIGEALERLYAGDLDAHVAELAHHFYEADAGSGAEKAISLCEAAGDAALRSLAYEEGVLQFERAGLLLDRGAGRDKRRAIELMLKLAGTRFAAGISSIQYFVSAGERGRDAGEWDLVARAVLRDPFASGPAGSSAALWLTGHPRFEPLLHAALAGLPAEPSVLRACALAYRPHLAPRFEAVIDQEVRTAALDGVQEAQAMARALGDPAGLCFVLYWSQGALWTDPSRRVEQIGLASELVDLAHETGDRQMVRAGRMWRMWCLMSLGDPAMDEDLNVFHEMSEEFRIRVMTWWSNVCVINRRLVTGAFAEAERLMAVCLALAPPVSEAQPPEDGDAADVTATFGMQLVQLRTDQGRSAEVEVLVRNAAEQFPEVPSWRTALARCYVEMDRPDDARREIEPILALGLGRLQTTPFFFDITLPLLAEVCAASGEKVIASELYDALLPYESLMLHVAWRAPLGAADRLLGLIAELMSRWADADRHFANAIEIQARLGARPWVARTQLDYARMLRKRGADGDRERARVLLESALATAREIGMAKVAADCEALLAEV